MLKRIWKNLKWLFNHPPTNVTALYGGKCDYCGGNSHLWNVTGVYCICAPCLKKVYDRILIKKKKGD